MTQSRPTGGRPGPRPAPRPAASSENQGSGWGIAVVAGLIVSLILIVIFAFATGGGEDDGNVAAPDIGIAEQLKDANYKKVNTEKHHSAEAKRDVVTETWERSQEPQQVIITDDSPHTTAGVMVVNAVNYRGSDGGGNLSCQPDPEHSKSTLEVILADANRVRQGVNDGSLRPDTANPDGFPYYGEFMGCVK